MKGVVFKSFETFIETRWSSEMVDQALDLDSLSTGGAYTSVGDYPSSDMVSMAVYIAEHNQIEVSALVHDFGQYLFHVLAHAHEEIIDGFSSCVDMLAGIESVIHRDVRKLYSNAELPHFEISERTGDRHLVLVYKSARPFADLAEGLIHGAFVYYGVKAISSLTRYDLAPDGTHAQFTVQIDHDRAQTAS